MKNSEKLRKGSNDGVVWMLPQVQAIKETSVAFNINKMIQGCFGMVGGFKMSNPAGTSICCGSADNMLLNPTLFIFLTSLVEVGISKERTAYYSI